MTDMLAELWWDTIGATWENTYWNIPINGRNEGNAGTSYMYTYPSSSGGLLKANVSYEAYGLDDEYRDVYFLVTVDDVIVYHALLYDKDSAPPGVAGEFELDYTVAEGAPGRRVCIGFGMDPEYDTPEFGIYGYGAYGNMRLYVDSVTPPEPPEPPEPVELVKTTAPQHVYEFEKGWGFDGKYIPHFVELNWWFGDSPVINTGIQKLRVHGLSKGKANLTLAVSSMTEPRLSYDKDYSEPQWIDLPREQVPPTADFVPVTNYTDTASRGISTQLKFEGRLDPTLEVQPPEPPHVLQVLVIQGSPAGTGATSN